MKVKELIKLLQSDDVDKELDVLYGYRDEEGFMQVREIDDWEYLRYGNEHELDGFPSEVMLVSNDVYKNR